MAHLELASSSSCTPRTPPVEHALANSTYQEVTTALDTESARNQLIDEHLPMVRRLALRMRGRLPQHVELEDLVSAGTLGLVEAVSKLDSAMLLQFGSYAQTRIRGAMLDSLRKLDWSPRSLRRQEREMQQAIKLLAAKDIFSPSDSDIANEMSLPLLQYQKLRNALKGLQLGSLQAERNEDSGGEQEIQFLPASPAEDPLFRCLQSEIRDRLSAAINALPEKQRLVLTLYYYEELNMREISEVMAMTGSRVSQLHSSAIAHLRFVTSADLDDVRGKGADRREGGRGGGDLRGGSTRSARKDFLSPSFRDVAKIVR